MYRQKLIHDGNKIKIDSSAINRVAGLLFFGFGLALVVLPGLSFYDNGLDQTIERYSFLIYLSGLLFVLSIGSLLLSMKTIVSSSGQVSIMFSFCGFCINEKKYSLSSSDNFSIQKQVAHGRYSDTVVYLVNVSVQGKMVSIAKTLNALEAEQIKEELELFMKAVMFKDSII